MKKLAAILCLSALTTGAFAQGLVNFFNNGTTLASFGAAGNTQATSGAAGSYYFGLLTSATGAAGSFTFANVYATNQAVAGRFFGGASVAVTGWAAGATEFYEIAGWSSTLGATFNAAWLNNQFGGASGFFGLSGIGSGQAGGSTATGTLPNFNLFGGTGLTSGFNMGPTTVTPEPTSMALAGLGAAALLIFRRRK